MSKAFSRDISKFLSVIPDIYQASWEGTGWASVLQGIAVLLKADAGVFYSTADQKSDYFLYSCFGMPEEWADFGRALFWQQEIWRNNALQTHLVQEGAIKTSDQLSQLDALNHTHLLDTCLKPCGMDQMMVTVLFDDHASENAPRTHLILFRVHGAKKFGVAEKATMQMLLPHLQAALVNHWRLLRDRIRLAAHETLMARQGFGMALIGFDGQSGKLIYVNNVAEDIFNQADGLSKKNDQISVRHGDRASLSKLFADAMSGCGGSLMLQRPSGKNPYHLISVSLPLSDDADSLRHVGKPTLALLILDPTNRLQPECLADLAKALHLTAAEKRVLESLLLDMSPKQIALRLDLSIHTVRSHLSGLYAKTGTQNQRELISMAMRLNLSQR